MSAFQKIVSGEINREVQKRKMITKEEELIFKPHTQGLWSLSREEIQQYISFNISEMKKTNMNIKTIIICEETQKFLKNNKQMLLNNIINKEEEENER